MHYYKKGKISWDNTIDLAYGFLKTTSLGSRKSDDRIDLLSKYGYEIGKKWYLSGLVNFQHNLHPDMLIRPIKAPVLTSDFLSPAYLIISPGLNYKPNDNFLFLFPRHTVRWTIVKNDSLSSAGAYGVDSGKQVKLEFGAYSTIILHAKDQRPMRFIQAGWICFPIIRIIPRMWMSTLTNLLAVKVTGILTMTCLST